MPLAIPGFDRSLPLPRVDRQDLKPLRDPLCSRQSLGERKLLARLVLGLQCVPLHHARIKLLSSPATLLDC